jgi:hypothetical protein
VRKGGDAMTSKSSATSTKGGLSNGY